MNQSVTTFVDWEHPLKVVRLRLHNQWNRVRRVTVTYALDWVLGHDRSGHERLIVPEHDFSSGALLARNAYDPVHGERVAFLVSNLSPHGITCDGREFLGPNGCWTQPPGLWAIGLSGFVGPSDRPAGVYQVHVNIDPGETQELHFAVGLGADRAQALDLARTARDADWIDSRWEVLLGQWDDLLGRCQIKTPDPALNLLINRWLPYQAVVSRLWARNGFYQSAGGYGFRDQLQDALGLLLIAPDMLRDQIRRAAAVQFEEGDVLHWWHREPLRGVRTRCSDDLL